MSAQALRKLPAAEPSRKPRTLRGIYPMKHEWARELRILCGFNATMRFLLDEILSLANRRALDGSVDGWTGPVTTAWLARESDPRSHASLEGMQTAQRNLNEAITSAIEMGLIERKDKQTAVAVGILSKDEAGRARQAYVYRALTDRWAELARQRWQQDLEIARQAAEEEEDDEPPEPPAAVVKLIDEPLLVMPGAKSKPIPISDAVRPAWTQARAIEVSNSDQNFPIPLVFDAAVIEAGVVRIVARAAPNHSANRNLFSDSKGVIADSTAFRSAMEGLDFYLDEKLLAELECRRAGAPVGFVVQYIAEVVEGMRKNRKPVRDGILPALVDQAVGKWRRKKQADDGHQMIPAGRLRDRSQRISRGSEGLSIATAREELAGACSPERRKELREFLAMVGEEV